MLGSLEHGVQQGHAALNMRLPSEAGELIVDLRRAGAVSHPRLVFGGLFVVLGLVVAGDPSAWPVLAFFGGIAVVTWLLLAFVGSVLAVCDRGLIVRRRWSRHLVAWAHVRGLRQRRLADRGGKFMQTVVETDRGILLTPYDPEVERALKVATKAAKKYRNALRELAK